MIRFIFFALVLALIVLVSVWLTERPGSVTVEWLGWRLDTYVPIVLLAFMAIVALSTTITLILRSIFRMPGKLSKRFSLSRQTRKEARETGNYINVLRSLVEGLAAVIAKDNNNTEKVAKLFDEEGEAIPHLLYARHYQMSNNKEKAAEYYKKLLDAPQIDFNSTDRSLDLLALQGLIDCESDINKKIGYAERAFKLAPELKWTGDTLLNLQMQSNMWEEAYDTIEKAAAEVGDKYSDEEYKKNLAIILYNIAKRLPETERNKAIKYASNSNKYYPYLIENTLLLTSFYKEANKLKKASNVIIEAWKNTPSTEILDMYISLWTGFDNLKKYEKVEQLAAVNPEHPQSILSKAEYAFNADLWEKGKALLDSLSEADKENFKAEFKKLEARYYENAGDLTKSISLLYEL